MFKKISFFALIALFIVGCSSNEKKEESEKRNFKDSVYAFINSNPRIAGFGKISLDDIMKDGDVANNSAFQMFAAPTFDEIKGQIDIKTPMFIAMEAPEMGRDPVVYIMAKLKDKKAFEKNWTAMGYMFKEHKGISYAEDDGQLIAMRNETIILIMLPGDYNGKEVVAEAFGFMDDKIAPADMKKRIDAPGDLVMHFNIDQMKDADPSMAMIPKGMEADLSLNFEKGKLIFEASSNNVAAMEKQLGMKIEDEPIIAKKVTDADGNILMAMQLSMSSSLMDMLLGDENIMEEAMSKMSLRLAEIDEKLVISDISEDDVIKMPGTGRLMGSAPAEIMIDFDALSDRVPVYGEQMEMLDYATYEMKEDKVRIVIAMHNSNENFLATVFKAADEFLMSGGLAQLAAMN